MVMGRLLYAIEKEQCVIRLVGEIRFNVCQPLDEFIKRQQSMGRKIVFDLTQSDMLDSTALGVIAQVAIARREAGLPPSAILVSKPKIHKLLTSVCFDKVFDLIQVDQGVSGTLSSLDEAIENANREALKKSIQEAHENLMRLSFENQLNFRNVLDALQMDNS
jgi:anti-anti-sigma regulatory factor